MDYTIEFVKGHKKYTTIQYILSIHELYTYYTTYLTYTWVIHRLYIMIHSKSLI